MNKFIQGLVILLVLAMVAAFGWLVWVFVANIGEADASVKAALIGFSAVVITALAAHSYTKKREIDARLFADKRAGYTEVMDLIFDILMATKNKQVLSNEDMLGKMLRFKKALITWGGPKAITAWNEFELTGASGGLSSEEMLQQMEKILRAIREDLGHDDRTLTTGSLMALLIVPEDKGTVLGKK